MLVTYVSLYQRKITYWCSTFPVLLSCHAYQWSSDKPKYSPVKKGNRKVCEICLELTFPAGIYLLKVSNRNTRASCEICSKLTIKIPERRHWRCSGIFIVYLEHISHLVLVLLLAT